MTQNPAATRPRTRRRTGLSLLAALVLPALAGLAGPLAAQNMFAPVAKVNDSVITAYELSQRTTFLSLLQAPGDPRELAMTQLVEERLKAEVADSLDISIDAETLRAGMTEFAGRANLSPEEFIAALGQAGVAAETFRDFVANGMAWREVVRAKFISRIGFSEAEIDRAMAEIDPGPGLRVQLAEIMLPADTPQNKRASTARAAELVKLTTIEDFAAAARIYSISASKGTGGQIDWRGIGELPAPLAAQVRRMNPGDITTPLPAGERIALFQLRAKETLPTATPANVMVKYARYLIPGGRSPASLAIAERLRGQVDSCDDLYGTAPDVSEEALQITTRPLAEIPGDIALELATLDVGEISADLTRDGGQTLVLLMLCSRTKVPTASISRDAVREAMASQRLAALSDAYVAELRDNAFIEYYSR